MSQYMVPTVITLPSTGKEYTVNTYGRNIPTTDEAKRYLIQSVFENQLDEAMNLYLRFDRVMENNEANILFANRQLIQFGSEILELQKTLHAQLLAVYEQKVVEILRELESIYESDGVENTEESRRHYINSCVAYSVSRDEDDGWDWDDELDGIMVWLGRVCPIRAASDYVMK